MNVREQGWLEEYFQCWDATESARRMEYKWPDKQGPRLKKKFADEISKRLTEKHMGADEVLSRLADMARSNVAQFADVETAEDLKEMNGRAAVVRKFKKTIRQTKGGDVIESLELDLYDAQAALEKIGKHHALFKDIQITDDVTNLSDTERSRRIATILDGARTRRTGQTATDMDSSAGTTDTSD